MFGPDSTNNFIWGKLTYLAAEDCDRSSCACSTHENFEVIAAQRLAESTDRIKEFKEEIASQAETTVIEENVAEPQVCQNYDIGCVSSSGGEKVEEGK